MVLIHYVHGSHSRVERASRPPSDLRSEDPRAIDARPPHEAGGRWLNARRGEPPTGDIIERLCSGKLEGSLARGLPASGR